MQYMSLAYMSPPEPSLLTDEDSGDEDAGGRIDTLNKMDGQFYSVDCFQ